MLKPSELAFVPAKRTYTPDPDGTSIFDKVREEVDVRKILPPDPDAREFDRYELRKCINPAHPDAKPSMLVFADAVHCQGCGFHADAVDLYHMVHPELGKRQCAEALLSGDFQLEGEIQPRELRELDQSLALKYHLALAQNPQALARAEAFGFSRRAIQKFKLGLAEVLVRLDPDEEPTGDRIVERDINGQTAYFQNQYRLSVPVYNEGRLRQVLYRKLEPIDFGPKIMMEKNAGGGWLFNQSSLSNQTVGVFCSGWGDAIILDEWGIPAACGITGDGHFSPGWKTTLTQLRRPYGVVDSGAAGDKLRERLLKEIPWIKVIQFADGDVRSFFLSGGTREQFLQMMKKADVEATLRTLKKVR